MWFLVLVQDRTVKSKLVSHGQPRFTDNGDETVTDNLTGLMWTKDVGTPAVGACTGGGMTWQDALNYVACLNSSDIIPNSDKSEIEDRI
jgi:hypothetical protein